MLSRESSALSSLRRPSPRTRQAAVFAVPTDPDIVLILVAVPLGYLVYASLQTASPGAPNAEFTLANIVAFFTEERILRGAGELVVAGPSRQSRGDSRRSGNGLARGPHGRPVQPRPRRPGPASDLPLALRGSGSPGSSSAQRTQA